RRRPQKRDGLRRPDVSNDFSVRLERDDMAAMARLGDGASSHLNERFSNRDLLALRPGRLVGRHLRKSYHATSAEHDWRRNQSIPFPADLRKRETGKVGLER